MASAAAPDLLYASAKNVNAGEDVNLAFRHKMYKLVVNLSSNYFTEAQMADATVKPVLKSTVDIDTKNGEVYTGAASGGTITYKVPIGLTVLESGRILTLNLALNRYEVRLEGQDVGQWGDQTPVDEEILVGE